MTGLDPTRNVIVEIATLVTDDELEIVAEGPDLVVHQPPEALAAMDDVVREMHTRSGLLPAIEASTVTLEDAGAATLAFIRQHVPEPRTVPLCGNSIGTDRRFLAAYLPEIENYLHYRSVDVSTIKELARRWDPEPSSSRRPARRPATGPSTTSARASTSCAATASTCSASPAVDGGVRPAMTRRTLGDRRSIPAVDERIAPDAVNPLTRVAPRGALGPRGCRHPAGTSTQRPSRGTRGRNRTDDAPAPCIAVAS